MSAICPECGAIMSHGGTRSTYVGYISPPGHDHDDNCLTRQYICKNGHRRVYSIRRRCPVPGCGWVGISSCHCHGGVKLDNWPGENNDLHASS